MSVLLRKTRAHLPIMSVTLLAGAKKNCSSVPEVCSVLTLCPMPQTAVPKRVMKMKPRKKKMKPPPEAALVVGVVGVKSVTPRAKKKNHMGVLMNSPIIHAG